MKTLLAAVNAKYSHSNLAVYTLKAYAEKHGCQIELAEYTINHSNEYILRGLFEQKPDIVAFSCYIWNIRFIEELVLDLAKILPTIEIWLGGPEVSYNAQELIKKLPMIRGVMRGEGENSFTKLVQAYNENDGKFSDHLFQRIEGISWRDEYDAFKYTPDGSQVKMDDIPFCYSDLSDFENRIIYYETSRGCPFSCSYCLSSIHAANGSRVRFRNLELVKSELKFFLKHKVPQVKFVDRTFNCDRKRTTELWQFLMNQDNGVTNFHFEIGADLLSVEELKLLAQMRPGLVQLEIGVQSVNKKTIAEINRTMKWDVLSEKVKIIKKNKNIHQHLDLIAGLPWEGLDSFKDSFGKVYELKPEQLQLGFLKVLKGSEMEKRAEQYSISFRSMPPYEVLSTEWLTHEELLRIKSVEEMTEVYYNSGQFTYTLEELVKYYNNPFDLYDSLAQYYIEKGYNNRSLSRMERYEILRNFILEKRTGSSDNKSGQICCKTDVFQELLLFDLYLRENMRNRPSWASDLSEKKDNMKAFYMRESKNPVYLEHLKTAGYTSRQMMNMTHMEIFTCSQIRKACGEDKENQTEYYVLFDYHGRNPLTYEAAYSIVEEVQE